MKENPEARCRTINGPRDELYASHPYQRLCTARHCRFADADGGTKALELEHGIRPFPSKENKGNRMNKANMVNMRALYNKTIVRVLPVTRPIFDQLEGNLYE